MCTRRKSVELECPYCRKITLRLHILLFKWTCFKLARRRTDKCLNQRCQWIVQFNVRWASVLWFRRVVGSVLFTTLRLVISITERNALRSTAARLPCGRPLDMEWPPLTSLPPRAIAVSEPNYLARWHHTVTRHRRVTAERGATTRSVGVNATRYNLILCRRR